MLKILNIFISQTMLLSDDNFSKKKIHIFTKTIDTNFVKTIFKKQN